MNDGDIWPIDALEALTSAGAVAVGALALPVAIVAVVVLLRDPLGHFIRGLGGRVSKVSFGGVTLELAEATQISPAWTVAMPDQPYDVRRLSPAAVFDSYADSLLSQIAQDGVIDYAIVDLGDGESWLTSRLYLFAVLLHRMRGLRVFVFVHSDIYGDNRFLGTADVVSVRWALARHQRHLEEQWALAYQQELDVPVAESDPAFFASPGRIEKQRAGWIARRFLEGIQSSQAVSPEPTGWQALYPPDPPGMVIWEHATWLRAGDVVELLSGDLSKAAIVEDDRWDLDRRDQLREVVSQEGDFVAVLRNGSFDRLIDRREVVERVAVNTVRNVDSAS